jgi:dipeptidyl aminopeptidase/acylaminoacyl peptidase
LIPTRWYLFDEDKKTLEEISSSRPWLDNRLAQVRYFLLKTRDGLEIPSYYILPRDYKPGTKIPTIVHIHGGPQARDVRQGGTPGSGFGVLEGQIMAAQGYAVVLPNFRITPEMGAKIYYPGFGTFGRQMIDDHEDAAKWAVDQGFADPSKMCISGASYGGYAALQSITRPTNPFVCAIAGVPVADIKFQNENADYARSQAGVDFWKALVGVKSWDEPIVRQLSPVFNADKIKVPVYIYAGEEDTRTPPQQAIAMAEALTKAGNPPKDFFMAKGEGHSFGKTESRQENYERIFKFLDSVFKR